MRKRILALALSVVMLLGLAWQPVYAAGGASPGNEAYHWFYRQLEPRAQKIYDAILDAYTSGALKDGKAEIRLNMDGAAAAYLKGDRSLFNDFSAAKDAFDLEHPEAWYFDSAQLSLTVEGSAASAKASMGTGRSDSYFVPGADGGAGLDARDEALKDKVAEIVTAARTVERADGTYEAVRYVHDRVVESISYKYEFECAKGNEGFIRTAYALVTGEGVCEGYVRSFQMILNEMGIPCVPVHGTQTSGDPEAHMWCAVYISDGKGAGWYVVDPTWDDPIPDGHERHDYFMVGNDVTGSNWIPSGYVSTGPMEFAYPDIAPRSYGAGRIGTNGLVVTYDDGLMEGTAATVYRISYNGDGLVAASRKGYYFLVKMYDINADGSANVIDQWYYPLHMLLGMGPNYEGYDRENLVGHGNKYYHDEPGYLVEVVSNCEYVEFGVTDVAPPAWEKPEDLLLDDGYYKGGEDHIIAQTGLIYNPNGGYEQPPYVKNVLPAQNVSSYVGATHTFHMEFTDPLFHPDAASVAVSAALGKVNEAETAMAESVGVDYTGINYSWGVNSGLPHQFADRPVPQNVRWYCTEHDAVHTNMAEIARYGSACRLTVLEFEFTPSRMWADDSVFYQFYLTGLVGVKSNKKPSQTGMAFAFENASVVCMYRCVKNGGIDWNLWGQPQLLDDPNNLDFSKMVVEGIDGKQQSIAELYANMHLDDYDMNGRLLLVVEDAGSDREKADTMSDLLESRMGVDLREAVASALYEIDFARVCSKTVVETGDSLRMQVGFPAGFDAGKLSQTVFKVYHFIKNAKGEITGVEEIPVTVTPYGLVFQVSSFSPFAIVAEEAKSVDSSRSVVLVSGGNGTITSNYRPGGGEVEGTLKLSSGDSYTVTVTPDKGYALESITAAGLTGEIKCENGAFTLSYNDIGASNAMIGVTFVEEEKAPEKVEVLSLCGHESVKSTGGKAATCTEDGYGPTVVCNICGQTISDGEAIKATGHVYEEPRGYREPTCTEPGTALKCTVCGYVSQAPALGHDYYEGVCKRDKAAEQCTVIFDPNGGQIVSGSGTLKLNAGTRLTAGVAPTAARSGFRFAGWRTAEDRDDPNGETVSPYLEITRSIVLYAMWDPADTSGETGYEIILNANGGTLDGGIFSVRTGADGKLAALPGDPVREGSDFVGWFTAPEGGTQITLNTVFTGSATIYAHWEPHGNSGGTPGSGAGGSTVVTETDADGNIFRQESFANGVKVSTKIPVNGFVTASVTLPAGMTSASVTIQAAVTAGTVAVNSATGEVVMLSVPVDGGLRVVLDSSADFILVDLSKDFDDMPDSHWAADPVDFVTAHGLFNGTGDGRFSPDDSMTRAMLMTVLARLNGVDTSTGSTWYEAGMEWAMNNEISDGTNPDGSITREQLATMLYRYAGSPEVNDSGDGVSGYPDAGEISDWASQAMLWAVRSGIIKGSDDGHLNPGGKAMRSEVSTMIERFCRNVAVG